MLFVLRNAISLLESSIGVLLINCQPRAEYEHIEQWGVKRNKKEKKNRG